MLLLDVLIVIVLHGELLLAQPAPEDAVLVPLVLVPVPVGGERLDADRAQKPARRFVPLRVPQVVGLVQENLVANLSPTGTRRKLTRQTQFRLDLMKSSKNKRKTKLTLHA